MSNLDLLFLVLAIVLAYRMGYEDGRAEEQEKQTFRRLDAAIGKVKPGGEK